MMTLQETETELSDVSLEEMAEESTDNAAGEEILDGGNVEHIDCPALLEQVLGIHSDEAAQEGSDGELESAGLVEAYNAAAAQHVPNDYLSGPISPSKYSIDVSQSGNTVTVWGTISSSISFMPNLNYVYVDGTAVAALSGRSIKVTFDMSKYVSTGYHTVWMAITDGNTNDMIGRRYMVCNTITAAPTYNGVFNVYSNYFDYYPYNVGFSNRAGNLYMEYSADGGKSWARSGYMTCNLIKLAIEQGYSISGLLPKTQYLTRIRYGMTATYSSDNAGDNKSYFFGGPVLNTTTIKTGAATKPKVKSVTAKAYKIKYRKIRWPSHYTAVGGMVFYHSAYTERFYTCKVKVTVKLKKKPGTKGVWITVYDHNGISYKKWVKGNKKKYSVKITPVYNYFKKRPPKHYKFTVSVCSGQSKEWGGYSPTYSKRKKLS